MSQRLAEKEALSSLESLAPELIDLILCEVTSISDLANFILSSRTIYTRFELRKQIILLRVLQNELGPVFVDARFLYRFPCAKIVDENGRRDKYCAYLETMGNVYHNLVTRHARGDDEPLDMDELNQLCRMQHSVSKFAEKYLWFMLDQLFGRQVSEEDQRKHTVSDKEAATFQDAFSIITAPASRSERLRIIRAIYRRQIICHAWAPFERRKLDVWTFQEVAALAEPVLGSQIPNPRQSGFETSSRKGKSLLAQFEPWEMEQVVHIDNFITELCITLTEVAELEEAARTGAVIQPMLQRIRKPKQQPQYEARLAAFADIFLNITNLVHYMDTHQDIMDVAISALLGQELPNWPLLGMRKSRIRDMYATELELRPLFASFQVDRMILDPARDRLERERSPLEFVGDDGDNSLKHPPFGWIDALDGRYLNWWGNAFDMVLWSPRPPDRLEEYDLAEQESHIKNVELFVNYGFVFWDQPRVEALKRLEKCKDLQRGWMNKLEYGATIYHH